MNYQADRTKSRTQWAKDLKGTGYKTFTYPTKCKRDHDNVFSVSEDGKCIQCVRLKDRKRHAKKLGLTLEEFEQQQVTKRTEMERLQEQRIADRVAQRETKRLEVLMKDKTKREAKELHKAEVAERQWWSTYGWRLERKIHRAEMKAEPKHAYIYAITNTVNGKTYIGSSTSIKTRLSTHRSGIKHGNHHVPAIVADAEKYGPEAFKIEILCTLPLNDKEQRLAIERHYIETWNGEIYNKHYHTENYNGNSERRAEHMNKAVANLK